MLEAGVEPSAVHVIAIGIDIEHFPLVTPESRAAARAALDLPADAFVVGSFQKDGVGWGEGLEPKLVKGPDVLVAALERVAAEIPELHVLLTGPARGYVRGELERRGIAYRHTVAQSRSELATAYHALDAYVVASRQEGGPKGVLESLAAGVPLVSTRVGQAPSIVRDGETGLLVDVDDVEAIAARGRASPRRLRLARVVPCGRTHDRRAVRVRAPRSPRGPRSSTASSSDMPDRSRIGRYTRAGARWSRLLTRRRPSAGLPRLLRPRPRPRPGRSRRRRHGEVPAPRDALPESSDGLLAALPRLDLAAARPAARCSGSHAGGGIPVVLNQDGVGYPGWAGDGHRGVQPTRCGALLAAADHVLYQSEFCKRSADEWVGPPGDPGRCSTTPSTSSASRPRRASARRRPGAAPRRRPVPGVPARARPRDARGASSRRIRMRGCSSPGGSSCRSSRSSQRLGLAGSRRRRSAATRSAMRPRSSGGRTSSCTRR